MSIDETVVEVRITLEQIDALLAGEETAARPDGPRGYGMAELRASTGCCTQVIQSRLRRLKTIGKLRVGIEMREGIDGRMHPVPVYFIG